MNKDDDDDNTWSPKVNTDIMRYGTQKQANTDIISMYGIHFIMWCLGEVLGALCGVN